MGNNQKRHITFQPTHFRFGPLGEEIREMITLDSDELEALYLADHQGFYHEACAKSLGVSRPTFAKILKSARLKSIQMLMYGKGIEISNEARALIVMFPTNDRISIHPYFITAKYFAYVRVENATISTIEYKENPIYQELLTRNIEIIDDDSAKGLAAGRLIPPLLKEGTLLCVASIGEGIRRNIEGLGISIKVTDETNIDRLITSLF